MASLNEVTLMGYLGRDPEIRYMPNGDPVATLSIGTSHGWTDKETGEQKEHTEWHRVVVFGKKVVENVVSKYLKKGSSIWVRGELRTRKWVDKDTKQDRFSTEIRSERIQLLDRAPKAPTDSLPTEQLPPEYDDDIPM